jgi:hypothetical protein
MLFTIQALTPCRRNDAIHYSSSDPMPALRVDPESKLEHRTNDAIHYSSSDPMPALFKL